MLQFCRRKQGRVTMFLLVFLLLISIPMIGGSANCERIRRMAASVISQIDGSDSLFSAGQSEEPRAAEVRTVNPTCPLLTAQRQELEPSHPGSRTAGGFIPRIILLCIAAAAAACVILRGRSLSCCMIPRRSRADERYRRIRGGHCPPVLN